jgi:hypothetical protein
VANKLGLKAVMFGLTLGIPLYTAHAQDAEDGIVDKPLATIQGETPGVHIDDVRNVAIAMSLTTITIHKDIRLDNLCHWIDGWPTMRAGGWV